MNNEYLIIKDFKVKKSDVVEVSWLIETATEEGDWGVGKYANKTYITGADFIIHITLKGEKSYKFFNFYYESELELKEAYLNIMSQLPEDPRLKLKRNYNKKMYIHSSKQSK